MRNEHRLAPSLMEPKPANVCVPVCVSRASELPRAIRRAAEVADIIELRLDCMSESELAQGSKEIWAAVVSRNQPIILTLRPARARDKAAARQNRGSGRRAVG